MLRLFAVTSIFIISGLAHAEVPHAFVAGERASAQQVNENFANLDSRITSLEDTSCTNYSRAHSMSYSARPSNVGDEIVFLGNSYRMVKVPFVEFATGERFTVKFPTPVEPDGNVRFQYVQTWHERLAEPCLFATLAGYPSMVFVNENRELRLNNDGYSTSESRYLIGIRLQIMVNETLVQLNIDVRSSEQEQVVAIGDYDFSDNLDTAPMLHRDDLLFAADDLIDYIVIQAEP